MNIFQAIILGIVQGFTEFLPISSSGHLLIARKFLGLPEIDGFLLFDAVLHLATAFVILIYFWKDISLLGRPFFDKFAEGQRSNSIKKFWVIGIATIPAVILGFTLETWIIRNFRELPTIIIALVLGAGLLALAEWISKKRSIEKNKKIEFEDLPWHKSLGVGFFQALALIPGMSRSGSTLSGGVLFGLNKVEATKFAFLLGLPVLFGVGGLKLIEALSHGGFNIGLILAGSVSAVISGIFSMKVLMHIVKNKTLYWFVGYRIVLAMILVLLLI